MKDVFMIRMYEGKENVNPYVEVYQHGWKALKEYGDKIEFDMLYGCYEYDHMELVEIVDHCERILGIYHMSAHFSKRVGNKFVDACGVEWNS